ncbi:MAG: chemotaxis protein CheX [Paenisporosarcina sp.]
MINISINTQTIFEILNGLNASIKNVIPLNQKIDKPSLLSKPLQLQFGVLIGIVGDVTGKIVFTGERNVFSSIGESMFGMSIEGDMLSSFSGELGNMLAAGLSSRIAEHGIATDITSPTVMEGNTTLSGFEKAFHIQVTFDNEDKLHIYLMLD